MNLELSAVAALKYFRCLSNRKFSNSSQWEKPYSDGSQSATQIETIVVKGESVHNNVNETSSDDGKFVSDSKPVSTDMNVAQTLKQAAPETTAIVYPRDEGETLSVNHTEVNHGYNNKLPIQSTGDKDSAGKLDSARESFLMTLGKLGTSNGVPNTGQTDDFHIKQMDQDGVHDGHSNHNNNDAAVSSNSMQALESLDDRSENCKGSSTRGVASLKHGQWLVIHSIPMWPLSLKSPFLSLSRSAGAVLSEYFGGQIQKVNSRMNLKLEDLVAELAEEIDVVQPEGIEKLLPITLDSIHFTEGTLMLLGYGDREPREIDGVNGHVKFQNHYSCVYVQLSGNCKEWRSDIASDNGGWLSTNVFVDCIEQT